MRRRDILIGGACVVGAAAALALKPRNKISLMPPGKKLAEILPRAFGGWTSQDVSDMYAPETEDSLLARLYGETVGRIYSRQNLATPILMLMAHGDSESNELQLHRPEVCYPAFGFSIVKSATADLKLGDGVTLPGRHLVAQSADQTQAVTYWTRLGEYFPVGVTEQRLDRLNTAVHRYIPDGLLARFSITGSDTETSFSTMDNFIQELVHQVPPTDRVALLGSRRAAALNGVRQGI
jgi:EpsI family protein